MFFNQKLYYDIYINTLELVKNTYRRLIIIDMLCKPVTEKQFKKSQH